MTGRQIVSREAGVQRPSRQPLVWQIEPAACAQRPPNYGRSRRSGIDAPRGNQYSLSGNILEVMPQLIRAPQQRNVRRMLPVREPDYPRQTMRRAEVVRNIELFEAEHAGAAAREVIDGGASHPADANDD